MRRRERLATYAVQHRMAVVLANHGGPTGGLVSAGSSGVWSEQGKRVVELGAAGAGVAVATETPAGWVGETRTL